MGLGAWKRQGVDRVHLRTQSSEGRLRVIGSRTGCEYWAMRCDECGGIHLDILEPNLASGDEDPLPAA